MFGGIVVVQSLVSFMLIMISRSSFQVFNLLCRLYREEAGTGKVEHTGIAEWREHGTAINLDEYESRSDNFPIIPVRILCFPFRYWIIDNVCNYRVIADCGDEASEG